MIRSATAELAPAKVNLCLHITGRRPDGYHELDSIVAFATEGDVVQVEPAEDGCFLQVSGSDGLDEAGSTTAVVPADIGNLAWRALALAATRLNGLAGLRLGLDKRLPAGAGLGGGSSDAAAVLRAVARAVGRPALLDGLAAEAERLGADVPMCLECRPWRATGIGEQLEPVAIARDLPAVLVWPGQAAPTPAVFGARTGAFGSPVPEAALKRLAVDPIGALTELRNDLTAAACAVQPAVAAAHAAVERLQGCRLARMSGSGSAVFGLFDDAGTAAAAAKSLGRDHPGWWIRSTTLRATRIETALPG